MQKFLILLFVGKKEVADKTVTVRKLGSDKQVMKKEDLFKIMLDLNKLPLN